MNYIPFTNVILNKQDKLEARAFDSEKLAQSLNISLEQLAHFATLVGNDIMRRDVELRAFLSSLGVRATRHMEVFHAVAGFLQQQGSSSDYSSVVFANITDSGLREIFIESYRKSLSQYQLEEQFKTNEHKAEPSSESFLYHRGLVEARVDELFSCECVLPSNFVLLAEAMKREKGQVYFPAGAESVPLEIKKKFRWSMMVKSICCVADFIFQNPSTESKHPDPLNYSIEDWRSAMIYGCFEREASKTEQFRGLSIDDFLAIELALLLLLLAFSFNSSVIAQTLENGHQLQHFIVPA